MTKNGLGKSIARRVAPVLSGISRGETAFGPTPAMLKEFFGTGRIPRQQDFTSLLQIAEIGRLITSQSPDQPMGSSFGLTIGPTGKFEVTPEFIGSLVSVEAFAALSLEDQKAIYDLLTQPSSKSPFSLDGAPPRSASASRSTAGPIGLPVTDLLRLFDESTVQLEGDYGDLIDVADVGRRTAGLAPGQSGPGNGMGLDPESGRMDFSEKVLDSLVSVIAFESLSNADRAAIYDLLRYSRTIFPADPRPYRQFGESFAMSGDGTTLAVPDTNASVNGMGNAGLVDIYRKQSGNWVYVETITSPIPQRDTYFGYAVSLPERGDTTLVICALDAESAKVYTYSNDRFEFKTDLTSIVTKPKVFHNSMKINPDGNVVAVGYYQGDSEPTGLVSIFMLDSQSGDWTGPVTISPSPGIRLEEFGTAVSLDKAGEVLAVGAPRYNNAGRAYVFRKVDGTWRQEVTFDPPMPDDTDAFGNTVSLSGDGNTLVIEYGRLTSTLRAGYCITRRDPASNTWSALQVITEPEMGDHVYGYNPAALSYNGDKIALPLAGASVNGIRKAGAVYLYGHSGSTWVRTGTLISPGPGTDYYFGDCISSTSDFRIIASGEPGRPAPGAIEAGCVSLVPLDEGLRASLPGRTASTSDAKLADIAAHEDQRP